MLSIKTLAIRIVESVTRLRFRLVTYSLCDLEQVTVRLNFPICKLRDKQLTSPLASSLVFAESLMLQDLTSSMTHIPPGSHYQAVAVGVTIRATQP